KRNCRLLVSSKEFVDICSDKWQIMKVFGAKGFAVPRSWIPDNLDFKNLPKSLFIKPRDGSASQNTFSVNDQNLEQILPFVPNPISQKNIKAKEITIVAILDYRGHPIHYVLRLRIRAQGGVSIQGVTMSDRDIKDWLF